MFGDSCIFHILWLRTEDERETVTDTKPEKGEGEEKLEENDGTKPPVPPLSEYK